MKPVITPIEPKSVRYIKLGEGGGWEKECIDNGILRFGFRTGRKDIAEFCRDKCWDKVKACWLEEEGKTATLATKDTNETKFLIEDPGDTLWVTFVQDRLYWGFLEPGDFQVCGNDNDSFRKVRGGWRCTDINGKGLTKSNLSGAITKLAAYRGTSCNVDVAEKLVDRINGKPNKSVEAALSARQSLVEALLPLIQSMHPNEFEDVVDLIFAASGWRRLSRVGGTQKTTDIDLELPSTQERAFVQVKSSTNQMEFDGYVKRKDQMSASKMFFVYHSGNVKDNNDKDVVVINGKRVAEMAINAGLTDWIIEKAS